MNEYKPNVVMRAYNKADYDDLDEAIDNGGSYPITHDANELTYSSLETVVTSALLSARHFADKEIAIFFKDDRDLYSLESMEHDLKENRGCSISDLIQFQKAQDQSNVTTVLNEQFGWSELMVDGDEYFISRDFESGATARAIFTKDYHYLRLEIETVNSPLEKLTYLSPLDEAEYINTGVTSLLGRNELMEFLIDDYSNNYRKILTAFDVPDDYSASEDMAIEDNRDEYWHLASENNSWNADLIMGSKQDIYKDGTTFCGQFTEGRQIYYHGTNVLILAENGAGRLVFNLLEVANKIDEIPEQLIVASALIVYKDKPKQENTVLIKLNLDVDEATDELFFYNANDEDELRKMLMLGEYGCDDWKLVSYELETLCKGIDYE